MSSLRAFVLLFSIILVSGSDLCLYYNVHEDNIETNVHACHQQKLFSGYVELEPETYQYFLLSNHNDTEIDEKFISSITAHVGYFVSKATSNVLVAVTLEKENDFRQNLPDGAEILAISPRENLPVDNAKIAYLKSLTKKSTAPDPTIQKLVDLVSAVDLKNFVEYLSGEQAGSPLFTRNTLSKDAVLASEWLVRQFASFGFQTTTQCYKTDYSCNVIATKLGTTLPREFVIVGAHYDSRASSSTNPTQRAPGANDDGSGTGTLLQIAKIIGTTGAKFSRTIRLVAFSGEEQGLLGSQAYAEALVKNNTNVVAMIQNDMIAYRAQGAGLLCGFPRGYTTPALTELAIATTNLYSPSLTTGRNDRCCSDHRSFFERGYPATDFSDTIGPIVDPEYHAAGDLVNRVGFDLTKYAAVVKGIFATTAVLAEPSA